MMVLVSGGPPEPVGGGPAVMFPGQGSQREGMFRPWLGADLESRRLLEEAADILEWPSGRWADLNESPDLHRTENAQPALYVACLAAWRKWQERGTVEPRVMLGHSLGELTALAAAGSFSFADGLRLVRRRGLAMAAADANGGMVAVLGLAPEKVEAVLEELAVPEVVIANFNSPRQVVLSGPAAELERAQKPLHQAGARLVALRVSVACHSPRMEGAAEELRPLIESLPVRPPRWPVISNVTGRPHAGPEEIRRRLREHIASPVRFLQSLEWVLQRNIRDFVEIGPGDALGGLVRQLDRGCRLTRFDGSGTEGAT